MYVLPLLIQILKVKKSIKYDEKLKNKYENKRGLFGKKIDFIDFEKNNTKR